MLFFKCNTDVIFFLQHSYSKSLRLKILNKSFFQVKLCTEGTSLIPLIHNPNDEHWKGIAFSQYPRKGVKGYSLRTARYRYTEWAPFKENKTANRISHQVFWRSVKKAELYDHDLDQEENVNLVSM